MDLELAHYLLLLLTNMIQKFHWYGWHINFKNSQKSLKVTHS